MPTSPSIRDAPRATAVEIDDDYLIVDLEDGRVIHVPLEWFPRLLRASLAQRSNYRLVGRGIGIHWPDVDEDLSVAGLLAGKAAETSLPETSGGSASASGQQSASGDVYKPTATLPTRRP
jgi:hypothetical protein